MSQTSVSRSSTHSGRMASSCENGAPVPMHSDGLTFEGRQAHRLREMEKRIEEEIKKKKKDWEKEVERMREEFLHLYPSDRQWGSEELLNDPLVRKRRGSTDILDPKKMRTLFMEYPDTGRRYKLRFNVACFDPKSIKVTSDGDRIIVKATKIEEDAATGNVNKTEYSRKIERPKEVDPTKLKSIVTSDGILIVEAPVPPHSLNLRKLSHSPSHSSYGSAASSRSRSPSNSPRTPSALPKPGMPVFIDVNGERRLNLIVDVGTVFKPKDVTVQVIKENRIQIKAKHEERTSEKISKSKYCKEWELGEKIEPFSVRAGLTVEGRLFVGAMGKASVEGSKKEAGEKIAQDINSKFTPCNVLDLASFPPTNVQLGQEHPVPENDATTPPP